MTRMINEAHRRYGRLLVVERDTEVRRNGHAYWNCQCDCGNTTSVAGTWLRSARIRSCGCLKKELTRKRLQLPLGEAAFNLMISRFKNSAKKRSIEWNLTRKQVTELTASSCFYCGIKPAQTCQAPKLNGDYIYNGIDRVDNKKGYEISNCVGCCWECNSAKGTRDLNQFTDWLQRVSNHMLEVAEQ